MNFKVSKCYRFSNKDGIFLSYIDHTLKDVILRIKLGFSFNARIDPDGDKKDRTEKNSNKTDGDKKDRTKKNSNKTDGVKKDSTEKDSNNTDGNKTDGDKTDGDKKDKTPPVSVRKSPRLNEDDHGSSDCLSERFKDPQTETLTLKL